MNRRPERAGKGNVLEEFGRWKEYCDPERLSVYLLNTGNRTANASGGVSQCLEVLEDNDTHPGA